MSTATTSVWCTAWVECRICGNRHVAVYPAETQEENNLECPRCHNMTCEPET